MPPRPVTFTLNDSLDSIPRSDHHRQPLPCRQVLLPTDPENTEAMLEENLPFGRSSSDVPITGDHNQISGGNPRYPIGVRGTQRALASDQGMPDVDNILPCAGEDFPQPEGTFIHIEPEVVWVGAQLCRSGSSRGTP